MLDTKVKQAEQDASKRLEELKLEYYTNINTAQDFTNDLQARLLKEEAKRIDAASKNTKQIRDERQKNSIQAGEREQCSRCGIRTYADTVEETVYCIKDQVNQRAQQRGY